MEGCRQKYMPHKLVRLRSGNDSFISPILLPTGSDFSIRRCAYGTFNTLKAASLIVR